MLREPDDRFPDRIEQWPAVEDIPQSGPVLARTAGWQRVAALGFHGRELEEDPSASMYRPMPRMECSVVGPIR